MSKFYIRYMFRVKALPRTYNITPIRDKIAISCM